MKYDSVTRPTNSAEVNEERNKLLRRGWHPVPAEFGKDAMNRVPHQWASGLSTAGYSKIRRAGSELVNVSNPPRKLMVEAQAQWVPVWCICLWRQLALHSEDTARSFALELPRYRDSINLQRAILISGRVAGDLSDTEKIATDAALRHLDVSSR